MLVLGFIHHILISPGWEDTLLNLCGMAVYGGSVIMIERYIREGRIIMKSRVKYVISIMAMEVVYILYVISFDMD